MARSKGSESRYFGAAAEHLVVSRLLANGLNAWKPEIDMGVDVAVSHDGLLVGIQVKSSTVVKQGMHVFRLRRGPHHNSPAGHRRYTPEPDFQFVVFVALPSGVAFVVPSRDIRTRTSLKQFVTLSPRDRRREAWHLIADALYSPKGQ